MLKVPLLILGILRQIRDKIRMVKQITPFFGLAFDKALSWHPQPADTFQSPGRYLIIDTPILVSDCNFHDIKRFCGTHTPSLSPATFINMKNRGFKSWVFNRIETQRKFTSAAAIGMATAGLVLFLVQAGILYMILAFAFSRTAALLVITAIVGGMGVYSWTQATQDLRDRKHKAKCNDGTTTLNIVPGNPQVWSWAFGSMDTDQSIPEKMIGFTMLVPRLFCGAWFTWQHLEDIKNIDAATTLKVLKVLFRSDHSVCAQAISDELGDADLNKAVRDVSLLDGVVFLTNDEISLTIAPRLHDDLEAWRAHGQAGKDSADLLG